MCDDIDLGEFETSIPHDSCNGNFSFTDYVNCDFPISVCELQIIQYFCGKNRYNPSDSKTKHGKISNITLFETNTVLNPTTKNIYMINDFLYRWTFKKCLKKN